MVLEIDGIDTFLKMTLKWKKYYSIREVKTKETAILES